MLYNKMNHDYVDLGENAHLPSELHPVVEQNKNKLVDKAAAIGIDVVITETRRSVKQQDKLYAQGRSTGGNIVTHAKGGESYHNYGLAIDYAVRNKNGTLIWSTTYDGNKNGKEDWYEVAEIAKYLGFEWGGDWLNFKDYPHLQMDFGLSINQLKKGVRPDTKTNQ
ncbi:peptidase [Virgibacillus phasianinus]|uniref:Peptidase n=2 Tax=Virgibacillus phasianinus TaxID=2017483 RepID=A0A220U976_9BACI|nr:peptidase [Virgibacillus phasianinus]